MTPKPKPRNYSKILEVLNTPQAAKTFSPKTYVDLVGQYSRKAFDNGEISKEEYMEIVQPLFGDTGIMATEKIKKYDDELNKYADGGRIGYNEGSPDTAELRKRVEELMDDGETFGDAVKKAVKELENG